MHFRNVRLSVRILSLLCYNVNAAPDKASEKKEETFLDNFPETTYEFIDKSYYQLEKER